MPRTISTDNIVILNYDDEAVIDGSKKDLLEVAEAMQAHRLHRYIGPLICENDRYPGNKILGTAILISENLILTAAHNVWCHDARSRNKNFLFYPGQRGHLN